MNLVLKVSRFFQFFIWRLWKKRETLSSKFIVVLFILLRIISYIYRIGYLGIVSKSDWTTKGTISPKGFFRVVGYNCVCEITYENITWCHVWC